MDKGVFFLFVLPFFFYFTLLPLETEKIPSQKQKSQYQLCFVKTNPTSVTHTGSKVGACVVVSYVPPTNVAWVQIPPSSPGPAFSLGLDS